MTMDIIAPSKGTNPGLLRMRETNEARRTRSDIESIPRQRDLSKPFKWDRKKQRAAELIASGRFTYKEICNYLNTTTITLHAWRQHPDFMQRVDEVSATSAHELLNTFGIADRAQRIAAAQEVWLEIQRFRQLRAEAAVGDVPGEETGLIQETKLGYMFDKQLIDAQIELQKYVAQEMGQWTNKSDVVSGGKTIEFTIPMRDDDVVSEQDTG